MFLRWLKRIIARLFDLHLIEFSVAFLSPENVMDSTVTLNASAVGAQFCQAFANFKDNDAPINPNVTWSVSDPSAAAIAGTFSDGSAKVQAIADPSGPSTKPVDVIATIADGPFAGNSARSTATVITLGDTVTGAVTFGPPQP